MTRDLPRALTVYVQRRTWGELAYALLGLPLGIAGFVFTVVTITVSAGLAVTFVGLPLLAASGLASRYLGAGVRQLANRLTTADVAAPPPFRVGQSRLGWIGAALKDGTAWRARLYLLLKLPMGIATFVAAVAWWTYGLGGLTYAIWRPFLPCNDSTDGVCHRGAQFGSSYTLDTPFRVALMTVIGLVMLLCAPWVVRGVVAIDRAAVRALLGPLQSHRVAELEHSRAVAVDDAASTLRRIERDLHDGTQARLVALAMNVGLAKEKLAEGGDPDQASELLERAHQTAKQAIAEVRGLARGIHPAVLDTGLDAALATLAAHSAVPVTVRVAVAPRPAPAIETIAYFCAAELVTNVAKHSGARSATVDVRTEGRVLTLTVQDDGHGGARVGAGTGLAGLTERVGTVDGTLDVFSPAGGPTIVTVRLPTELS